MQTYASVMYGKFCIGFIDLCFKVKVGQISQIYNYEDNNKVILNNLF